MLNLKIRASYAETIAKIDENLGEAFRAAHKAGNADEIELILRASRRSKGWLDNNLLNTVKDLIRQSDVQFETSKFVIDGYSEEKEKATTLDLLSDKLLIKRAILKTGNRSRGLNPNSAFNAIISAYDEIKDEIKDSPNLIL